MRKIGILIIQWDRNGWGFAYLRALSSEKVISHGQAIVTELFRSYGAGFDPRSKRLGGRKCTTTISKSRELALLTMLKKLNQGQNTLSNHLDEGGNPSFGLPLPVVGVIMNDG